MQLKNLTKNNFSVFKLKRKWAKMNILQQLLQRYWSFSIVWVSGYYDSVNISFLLANLV